MILYVILLALGLPFVSPVANERCTALSSAHTFHGPFVHTALASFPGSGNTWVRSVVETAAGFKTGSVYLDPKLLCAGFEGEGETEDVVLVKTHWPWDASSSDIVMDSVKLCLDSGQSVEDLDVTLRNYPWQVDRAVVLVRQPLDAMRSLFHLQTRGGSHDAEGSVHAWESWRDAQWIRQSVRWATHSAYWRSRPYPCLVVKYEDLVKDPLATFQDILNFVNATAEQSQLQCALNMSGRKVSQREHSWVPEFTVPQLVSMQRILAPQLQEAGYPALAAANLWQAKIPCNISVKSASSALHQAAEVELGADGKLPSELVQRIPGGQPLFAPTASCSVTSPEHGQAPLQCKTIHATLGHSQMRVSTSVEFLGLQVGAVSFGCHESDWDKSTGSKRRIIFVARGECPFVDKVSLALKSEAAGLVLINSDDTIMDFSLGADFVLDIPVVMIAASDGERIQRQYLETRQSSKPVSVEVVVETQGVTDRVMCGNPLDNEISSSCEAHVPPSGHSHEGEKFLGFYQFLGRTSNRVRSLAVALAYAHLLNRTLVLRPDGLLTCHDVFAASDRENAKGDHVKIIGASEYFQAFNSRKETIQVYLRMDGKVIGGPYGYCDEAVVGTVEVRNAETIALLRQLEDPYLNLGAVLHQTIFDEARLARFMTLIPLQPSLRQRAEAWRRSCLPERYLCTHWRRTDFVTDMCAEDDEHCFQSLNYTVARILQVSRRRNLKAVFLATDASFSERQGLLERLQATRPDLHVAMTYNDPALTGTDPQCDGILNRIIDQPLEEQHVCSLATHLLLNTKSSFSKRIYLTTLVNHPGTKINWW